jgi:cysteine desulfurase
MPRTIYFDYNATTPLDPAVRDAMLPYLGEVWGNPSSVHHVGQRARAALDDARDRTSKALGTKPSEIIFTSGGTESNCLAIFGTARMLRDKGRHIITSAVEHHAVLHAFEYLARKEGFDLTVLPVDGEGRVSAESLRKAIKNDTILVSVQAANNEIGTSQPVAELGAICRERGVVFHTDAVQWFGKESVSGMEQFNADLISVCAHKFHGPKGAGLLYIRSPLLPDPILFGGGHENERRAGTENLAGIIGLVEGIERFVKTPVFKKERLSAFTQRLATSVEAVNGAKLISPRASSLCNTVSFLVERADSISLLANFDLEGICASSGSACSAGSLEPSHVVSALGVGSNMANSLVRFSIGRETTLEEVEHVERLIPEVILRSQRRE